MKIISFKIENYKSFHQTEIVRLTDGFNVLIGKNNVGKTALLEALGLKFPNNPHRGIHQQRDEPINPNSCIDISFSMSGSELKTALYAASQFQFNIETQWKNEPDVIIKTITSIINSAEHELVINARRVGGAFRMLKPPTHPFLNEGKIDAEYTALIDVAPNKTKITFNSIKQDPPWFTNNLATYFANNIYTFLAERVSLGSFQFGHNPVLSPNAANLPEVLNILDANPGRFKKFNNFINTIFNDVYWVTTRPSKKSSGHLEIIVWPVDPDSERDDLAIPLSECGTGIGQALAILYVILTSNTPKCIIIDEPNTFLHPGAAKKLIQILDMHPQHQYIMSTHSTEIIQTANPNTLILVKRDETQSILEPLDTLKIDQIRNLLSEIGVKLSDVFSADEILWVEGTTEETCFPKIFKNILRKPYFGISVVAVRNTGDFETKRVSAETIWDIYTKLSQGDAVLPRAIGFIFDQEGRSQRQMEDLSRKSRKRVKFLPRRTYENYLIHPLAISDVLNFLPSFSSNKIDENGVAQWLRKNGGKAKYNGKYIKNVDVDDESWIKNVHAPKLLADLFSDLSGNKEEFRKTTHSAQITEWLIANEPNKLQELANFLKETIGKR